MTSPCCQEPTRCVDTRIAEKGKAVLRRRECKGCLIRFNTHEKLRGAVAPRRKKLKAVPTVFQEVKTDLIRRLEARGLL